MKNNHLRSIATTLSAVVIGLSSASAQFSWDSGSDGSYGAIDVTTGTETIDLPPDGILNCTTIDVAEGATLMFAPNALNTPVYLLATGDVNIAGTIDVSGQDGIRGGTTVFARGGDGGPGGFRGGHGATLADSPGGDGHGPGGGLEGEVATYSSGWFAAAGLAAYSASPSASRDTNGEPYGSPILIPLVGGSGGGGTELQSFISFGGGGGGGAILVASSSTIALTATGQILANGGNGGSSNGTNDSGALGSGGAVRLVAPRVEGAGRIETHSGQHPDDTQYRGSRGRIRIDAFDTGQLEVRGIGAFTVGANLVVFPDDLPTLEVIEVAGEAVDPSTESPVLVGLGQAAPSQQDVRIRATGFREVVPVEVVIVPDIGQSVAYPLDIDNSSGGSSEAVVTVDVPPNAMCQVYVWTR